MTEEPLLLERRDGVVRLTLNRPARLNCVDRELNRRLREALEGLAGDPGVRAVVLSGRGRAFCTGQDLRERHADLQQGTPDLGAALSGGFNRIVGAIRALEVPVVAAVNGIAAGAGANLALACDLVLAARSARFVQSFAEVGLLPDSGGTWSLPRLVGEARARGLALLAEPLDAARAEQWGLIWRCVDDDALEDATAALLATLLAKPRATLAAIKAALAASPGHGLAAQLELEAALQSGLGRAPDYRAAVERFVAARAAKEPR
ncbi:MAG TPA: enoyl-CoA hydratase-related protein [Gammaproteobacteria bacterium]